MIRRGFALTLGFLASVACQPGERLSRVEGYASVTKAWPGAELSFCWKEILDAERQALIGRHLQEEFGRTGLLLRDKGRCELSSGDATVRLKFTQERESRVDAIGKEGRVVRLGLESPCTENGQTLAFFESRCILNTALHEFGHLWGLHHEMNRPDQKDCSHFEQSSGQGERGALQIGDYDPLSIMNYCQLKAAAQQNQLLGLSPEDELILRELYAGNILGLRESPSPYWDEFTELKFDDAAIEGLKIAAGFEEELDCKNSAAYRPVGLENRITRDWLLESWGLGADGGSSPLKICWIGKFTEGASWQDVRAYSSLTLLRKRDREPPRLSALSKVQRTETEQGSSLTIDIEVADDSDLARIVLEIVPLSRPFESVLSKDFEKLSEHRYRLRILLPPSAPRGSWVSRTLTLVDRYRNVRRLSPQDGFYAPGLAQLALEIP